VAALKPEQRLKLVTRLNLAVKGQPTRRVWIPKPGKPEKRPLGIPTMEDRARQALVKMAMEPEWEAKFEPNSYGFRPGRLCHDAIEAIYASIKNKKAYVLDADISGCFDNISHDALLDKLNTSPTLRRVIKGWLKAGIMEGDVFHKTEKGTPQGGVISPLLANVALHGLESIIKETLKHDLMAYARKVRNYPVAWKDALVSISIIRYADDFVVLHPDHEIVMKAKAIIEEWLKDIGLELKPSKTRIGHTLEEIDGKAGCDFLGFGIRQYPVKNKTLGFKTLTKPSQEAVKRHLFAIKQAIKELRGATQEAVIRTLNPVIKGWSRYYSSGVSRKVFEKADHHTHLKLWQWAMFRHPHKGDQWIKRKYFRRHGNFQWEFMTHDGKFLMRHESPKIQRHIKVQGTRTPYDGNWVYWTTRMGRAPGVSPRVARLMKKQAGLCAYCELYFRPDDKIEVHHWNGNHKDNAEFNLALLHRHCHDDAHGKVCMTNTTLLRSRMSRKAQVRF
jgi:RNA-directed DNA polymerase